MLCPRASPSSSRQRSWSRYIVKRCVSRMVSNRWLLRNAPARTDEVCLTFDDGPDPDVTPCILDLLGAFEAKATFFVIGERARQQPRLVQRILSEGHMLGNHTYYHRLPSCKDSKHLACEIKMTADVLKQHGAATSLFRPPWGLLRLGNLWKLWRLQQTVVLWSYDAHDCRAPSAEKLVEQFRQSPPQGGDIILLHDDQPQTAAALGFLLADLKQRGFRFCTPGDWLDRRSWHLSPTLCRYLSLGRGRGLSRGRGELRERICQQEVLQ